MDTLSRKQQSKYNQLVKDLEIFKRSAKKTGKTLEKYLTDLKLEPEIATQLAVKAQQIEDISKARSETIAEVAKNHKNIPVPPSESNEFIFKSKPEEKMKDAIKGRVLDIIKWGIIIIFVSVAFKFLGPKYYFSVSEKGGELYRCNSITGQVERWDGRYEKSWIYLE